MLTQQPPKISNNMHIIYIKEAFGSTILLREYFYKISKN